MPRTDRSITAGCDMHAVRPIAIEQAPQSGQFETIITDFSERVAVHGFVDNGTIKIGTALIP